MPSTARRSPNTFVSDSDEIVYRSAAISSGSSAGMRRLFDSTLPANTVDCITHLFECESMAIAVPQRSVGHGVGKLAPLASFFGPALRRDERPGTALDIDQPFSLKLPIRLLHRVRVHPDVDRELANGRQRRIRHPYSGSNAAPDLVHDLDVDGPRVG